MVTHPAGSLCSPAVSAVIHQGSLVAGVVTACDMAEHVATQHMVLVQRRVVLVERSPLECE